MNRTEYLSIVSETKVDISPLISIAKKDDIFRGMVVEHMINNNRINVYYHSYHILAQLAIDNPKLLKEYWDVFALLLDHENSYHRNYGMDLIASLSSCVSDEHMVKVLPKFCQMLYDEKISTRKYCITYSAKILESKPHLTDEIIDRISMSLRDDTLTDKHKNLLRKEFNKLFPRPGKPLYFKNDTEFTQ